MKNLQTFLNSQGFECEVDGKIGRETLGAAEGYLLKQCHEKGYRWLDGIIAKRMSNKYTNGMNDFAFVVKGGKVVGAYSWTTVPGHYYIYNPLTVGGITGAAVLVPGQYVDSHAFRNTYTNKWRSPYFEHIGTLKIYRDGNRNDIIDSQTIVDSPPWHGIFIHQMGTNPLRLDNWSAGCQGTVWTEWLKVCQWFVNGQKITYTLL
jgi:hypothetical protein